MRKIEDVKRSSAVGMKTKGRAEVNCGREGLYDEMKWPRP
jgi:hypothetical protein